MPERKALQLLRFAARAFRKEDDDIASVERRVTALQRVAGSVSRLRATGMMPMMLIANQARRRLRRK